MAELGFGQTIIHHHVCFGYFEEMLNLLVNNLRQMPNRKLKSFFSPLISKTLTNANIIWTETSQMSGEKFVISFEKVWWNQFILPGTACMWSELLLFCGRESTAYTFDSFHLVVSYARFKEQDSQSSHEPL